MAEIILAVFALVIALEGMTIFLVLRGKKLLAAAELRYRVLAEQLPAVVYSVEFGLSVKTDYVSPQLKEILGYEPEEWLKESDTWRRIIHPDDSARVIEEILKADAESRPYSLEYRVFSASGAVLSLRNRGAYYVGNDGKRFALGVMFDVSEEREAREAQKASLAEKELLLKEIHHRVKNNFQIISSLLRLQRDGIPEGSANQTLLEAEGRILAMALVHDSLYQNGDFRHIDFKPYAQQMGERLGSAASAAKAVAFSVEGDDLTIGLDTAIPLGLFLNEALMNAFTHAFPPGFMGDRSIRVRITNRRDFREVAVMDSGGGTGAVPPGSDVPAERGSLGLTLMGLLGEQLGGTMSLESSNGTEVALRFPSAGPDG